MIQCQRSMLLSVLSIAVLLLPSNLPVIHGFVGSGMLLSSSTQGGKVRQLHHSSSSSQSRRLWGSSLPDDTPIHQPFTSPLPPSSRRDALIQSWKTTVAVVLGTTTTVAVTSTPPATAASQARVAVWPGLEYLEPVYELQLSVTALAKSIPDPSKWPYLQQRLEKFFGGGLFSERNYYAGLGVQYMNQVQYDKNELPEYIKLDKEERFQSMEAALQAMEGLKTHLSAPVKEEDAEATKAVLQSDVDQVQASLNRWFGLVPKQDVERVAQLFVSVREADVDRNGRIDEQELANLAEEDRAIWKKRIDYIGG